jgi:hypothetical protein
VAVFDVPESPALAVPQDSTFLRLAKLFPEEPDALIGHVRVCGGSGRATARFYPAEGFPPFCYSVVLGKAKRLFFWQGGFRR